MPPLWCGRDAGRWWRGDPEVRGGLVASVERWVRGAMQPSAFDTGNPQFDGEWYFGTYQMAALGLGQVAASHPELRARSLALMTTCEEGILSERGRRFDWDSWKEDPLASFDGRNAHAAYLGYLNLALGMHRLLDPSFPHRDWHDRISAKLARDLAASPHLMIETYPGETYPVDNCAVVASLILHDRATGNLQHSNLVARWTRMLHERYIDRSTGLLIQAIDGRTGEPADLPRGSGSLLGAYFLGIAGHDASRELYEAGRRHLHRPFAGFGMTREYPAEGRQGRGDIDSGPIVFGRSISATGFLMGCARQQGDEATFNEIYRTVHLFGAPARSRGRWSFAMGGPLGDAMMLALLTAEPARAGQEKGGQ